MSKIYLLLGDSNIKKCIPRLGGYYFTSSTYVPVHNIHELHPALDKVTDSYQTVIFAGVTNILIAAGSDSINDVDRLEAINTSINEVLTLLR